MSQIEIGRVVQIWRYPVSSIGGERLEGANLSATGISGDRLWCVVDSAGEVAAPEERRRWRPAPDLLARNPERLELRFTDGGWLPAFTEEARHRLVSHFGFPVEIRPIVTGDGQAESDSVHPRYERRPIHLLTTASLRALSRLLPDSAIDPRRFRPNLVLESEEEGFPEQRWIETEFTVGSARLKVIEPCTRCAFTVLAQQEPTGSLDSQTSADIMATFRHLNREEGVTVVLITHEQEVARHADRVIAFRDGRIRADTGRPRPSSFSDRLGSSFGSATAVPDREYGLT